MASPLTTVPGELLAKRWESQFGSPKTIPPGMVFYWMARKARALLPPPLGWLLVARLHHGDQDSHQARYQHQSHGDGKRHQDVRETPDLSGLTHQCLYFEQPHTFEQILFIQTA
ncbi:hypothetical protein, partial [Aeromonas sp. QDB56]|uniref:hypothetical protein n=1 Tax=Aeromonas sp. QDB56 TaxID=2990495 RepID=UPI0022E3FCD3